MLHVIKDYDILYNRKLYNKYILQITCYNKYIYSLIKILNAIDFIKQYVLDLGST